MKFYSPTCFQKIYVIGFSLDNLICIQSRHLVFMETGIEQEISGIVYDIQNVDEYRLDMFYTNEIKAQKDLQEIKDNWNKIWRMSSVGVCADILERENPKLKPEDLRLFELKLFLKEA